MAGVRHRKAPVTALWEVKRMWRLGGGQLEPREEGREVISEPVRSRAWGKGGRDMDTERGRLEEAGKQGVPWKE